MAEIAPRFIRQRDAPAYLGILLTQPLRCRSEAPG